MLIIQLKINEKIYLNIFCNHECSLQKLPKIPKKTQFFFDSEGFYWWITADKL